MLKLGIFKTMSPAQTITEVYSGQSQEKDMYQETICIENIW
ncbi:hypothetical protein HMPREF1984_01184 [Leptotrichia sp. oral taxon 215 str. W9775]|nr:hypothetical protein HMPREF1984_01184 [Leptotrichia sp. oral taxon 215 str. W9775]